MDGFLDHSWVLIERQQGRQLTFPGLHLFRVKLAPLDFHRIESSKSHVVVDRIVDRLQIVDHVNLMLYPDLRESGPDLVYNAVLHVSFRIGLPESLIQSRKAVEHAEQHFSSTTVEEIFQYLTPTVRTFLAA